MLILVFIYANIVNAFIFASYFNKYNKLFAFLRQARLFLYIKNKFLYKMFVLFNFIYIYLQNKTETK